MSKTDRIAAYGRAWVRRLVLADLLLGMAAGISALILIRGTGLRGASLWALGTAILVVLLLLLLRRRANLTLITRHLDRRVPELEESAGLLLVESGSLSPLARLQRQRIETRFAEVQLPPLPTRPLTRSAWFSAALVAGSAVFAVSLPQVGVRPTAVAHATGDARFSLQLLERRVEPPGYTGLVTRRDTGWAGEVEEGARVIWRVRGAPAADGAWAVTAEGDTLRFERGRADVDSLALVANRGLALRFEAARGADTARSPWSLLAVRRDAPPTATLQQPPPRTVRQLDQPDAVPVSLLAADDYGIAGAELVLTVARGRGEGVQFRERRVGLGTGRAEGQQSHRYATVLAPRSLGLVPGDELYVHAEVRDGRMPTPHLTRTETVVIALADTAVAPLADLRGLLPPTAPEYFRSQRQIILDTERLIKERTSLTEEQFNFQSSSIGFDQGVLRIRYGELVGDESVDAETPEPTAEADAREEAAAPGVEAQHGGELHRHDDEENATRLAQSVKATLKSALAEMWVAERLLRTYQPEKALPAEYRALEYLKQVQQASRAYVQRVGFEPPPIDEAALRLSGSLTGVRDRQTSRAGTVRDSSPATRRALLLLTQQTETTLAPSTRQALDAAGSELAARAVEGPGAAFDALGALRNLLDTRQPTAGDVEKARTALWCALPRQPTTPSGMDGPVSPLARRFAQLGEVVK